MRSRGARLRNAILNIAAAGGAVCIIAVLGAVLFNISLIMFKTGSMAPAIPAGSLAVVQAIPASDVSVGDVVTVDRPGKLPITHRVQTVQPGEGTTRIITMKGDANAQDDPEPYVVDQVRVVLWSAPGLAYPLAATATPLALGATTVAVSALVTWVLWPRQVKERQVKEHGRRRAAGSRKKGGQEKKATAGAALILVPAFLIPLSGATGQTEASWQRSNPAPASLGALTVPAPVLNGPCSYNPGVLGLGAYVRIRWLPPSTYSLADAEVQASTSGLGSALAPLTGFSFTGSNTTGNALTGYVTDVPTNLLGGLLGLGTELQLAIVVKRYTWTSQAASVASNAGLVAGLGGSCRNLT
ncbi:signal peptidase I [Arthrobacter sp. EpRS71]|uniref:signal peptidase I n=1 Tax=Arthrobacter sp. EpRS71 TaxID=1743141 RepID=UPI0009E68820|nr:signal peptidase I [Arthrobacter sp. EpRS71]